MEFKTTVFKIKLNGVDYELHKPNLEQMEVYQEKFNDKPSIRQTRELLADLGLPIEASGKLEVGHLTQLVEILTDSKKV